MCTSDWVSLTFFPLAPKAAHHTWFYLLLFHFAMDPSIFAQEDMKTVLSLLLLLHNIVLHGYCFNKSLFGYISFWIDTNFPNCSLGSGWWRKWVEIYCHLLRRFLEKKVQLVTFGGFYLNNLHNHYASVHNNNFPLNYFRTSVLYFTRSGIVFLRVSVGKALAARVSSQLPRGDVSCQPRLLLWFPSPLSLPTLGELSSL